MTNSFCRYSLLLLVLLLAVSVYGQSRLKPGQVYQSGDSIYAPTSGVKAIVPQGWIGLLPQESRVFTLMAQNSNDFSIYVYAREDEIESIKDRWMEGVEIDAGIVSTLDSDPEIHDNRITGEFTQSNNPELKIIGEAVCGPYGICIISFAQTDSRGLDAVQKTLTEFTKSLTFLKPGTEGIYDNFDWAKYLEGKYIFNYQSNQYFRKENHLWMCPDGTFKSNFKRKGIVKDEAKNIVGKKKGTYIVSGKGKSGMITLTFKGAEPLDIDTEIRDDKVFINGFQFFVIDNNTCK